jgi:hypothetical protein
MYTIHKNVLSKDLCNRIIKTSDKYSFEDFTEEVDGRPAYEIDIYDSESPGDHILNKELWEISKNIYETKLKSKHPKAPEYVFLRRYTPDERPQLPLHLDENTTTVSFLLSNRQNFKGGDLYLFNRELTEKYRYMNYKKTVIKEEFVKNYPKLPIVNYNQGDMISYSGKHHLHGVLPVTSGARYTISFFFE